METASLSTADFPEARQRLLAELDRRKAEDRLAYYAPYPKQLEFHAAGATARERLLMAANQSGKSLAGGFEVAMHATGRYAEWWRGKRFDKPTIGWVSGTTNEVARDTVQRILVGRPGLPGTGAIPKDAIVELTSGRGIPDLLDSIKVRHVSGGVSGIGIKSYVRGREAFQGETLDYAWLDEEPPADVFTEVLTRTNVSQGPVWITFTPLLGMSEVVRRFLLEPSPHRCVITMTLDDVGHYTPEQRAQIVASYSAHEREARTRGVPTMGSGRVFTHSEESLLVDPFTRPRHWPVIGGLDFGWTHFAAFCEIWHDRDRDIVYLARTLRLKEQTPLQHVEAVRNWALQWSWPHDGRNQTLAGAGVPLMRQYEEAGLEMLFEPAKFTDGGNSVGAGIQLMNDRMLGGRWKVFRGQNEPWLEEYRLYHRDANGLLVKLNEDAICASRYALMCLRFAVVTRPKVDRIKERRVYRPGDWMSA